MIKIGVVNIDTSHPKAFAEYLMKQNRARYTAIYNDGFRGDDEVEAFIKNYGLEKRCDSIQELADIVDIGFIQSCNWDKHLSQAMPFLERGMPVFIDKPMVGNLYHCIQLEEFHKKGGVILGSSSVRYACEIANFLDQPEEERGKIMNIYGTAGVDEFNYAIHIVEAISQLAGCDAVSARFVGKSRLDEKVCETFFIEFKNGITATYNTFYGVWMPFELVIITTKGIYQFRIDTTKIYGALLDRICDYIERGLNSLAPVQVITDSIKIMLAGRISKNNKGITVRVADIPEEDPGYDGEAFELGYAKVAAKIYLK